MAERTDTRKQLIAALTKSVHGDLKAYLPDALSAVKSDPEFFAHLISWNARKGQVRDAKVALPVAALVVRDQPRAFVENACALIAALRPMQFLSALSLAREFRVHEATRKRLVARYLRDLEADRREWDRTALQHRDDLRRLYGLYHVAPGGAKGSYEDRALMKHKAEKGKFAVVRDLATLPAAMIAETRRRYQLPFIVVRGALGPRAKEQDVALALIESMTPTELVINTRALVRLGIKTDPVLRAAYEAAVGAVGTTKRSKKGTSTLRTTKVAKQLEADGDDGLASKLHAAQERQLQQLGGIEGDWLVLGDKSTSMSHSIDAARQVAAILARMVTGKVHLVFFDTAPRHVDATGKTYEEIVALTAQVTASGGTLIGVGLDYLLDRGATVDGIAIVSDGGENKPGYATSFPSAYAKYVKKHEQEPTVYFYKLAGDPDQLTAECDHAKIALETFDLRGAMFDYYGLPNLVQTMRVSRYSLADEIYATPLATLDQVLDKTKGMEVLRGTPVLA